VLLRSTKNRKKQEENSTAPFFGQVPGKIEIIWLDPFFCFIERAGRSGRVPGRSGDQPMIYSNLIYFLVVIFVFSTASTPRVPSLSPWIALPLLAAILFFFSRLSGILYTKALSGSSKAYFAAEKKLSILAVALFTGSVFLFDLKYYLAPLSLNGSLPVLENLAGLGLFFLFLILMWLKARPAYQLLFNKTYTAVGFVLSNIKANLPIVLPWLALSLVFDLLAALPFPAFQELLNSPWGDVILFLVFVVFLALFFPPLVRRLWNCRPMEPGPLRTEIEEFFRRQHFSSEILYWPLFEGQVLTAGIMGFVPRFRYLLVTPGLLSVLNRGELESVLAHEIGHVKKFHLVLYLLLFLGFSLTAGSAAEPLPYFLLGTDIFYALLHRLPVSPDSLLAFISGALVLVMMIVYFRFVFGWFIRNFERQADLYVFKAQGTSRYLISAFEKIAVLSGNIRDRKSWHHFGIGERIDFLERAEHDRSLVKRHDRRLVFSLVGYVLSVAFFSWSMQRIDIEKLAAGHELRYSRAVLEKKLEQEPDNSLWLQLLGDLMQEHRMEEKALQAYERALKLSPMKPDLANNLAWLLLTAQNKKLRDPVRALTLARLAATLAERAHVLDTLAVALWANGQVEEAIKTEIRAARLDPVHHRYYQAQVEKFKTSSWQDS
jgi:Zn-dependent protease with chaperone function